MADPFIVICRPSGDAISVVGYFPNLEAASAWGTENIVDTPWTACRPIGPDAFVECRDYRRAHRTADFEVDDA